MGCTDPNIQCGDQCIRGGFYCWLDPEDISQEGINGADVLEENWSQIKVGLLIK